MKIRVHTRACVCIVGFYTLIFHFPVLTQRRRSIKKSQEKKKKKLSLLFYPERIRKCPKSQEGTCPAEIRAYYYREIRVCAFQGLYISRGL